MVPSIRSEALWMPACALPISARRQWGRPPDPHLQVTKGCRVQRSSLSYSASVRMVSTETWIHLLPGVWEREKEMYQEFESHLCCFPLFCLFWVSFPHLCIGYNETYTPCAPWGGGLCLPHCPPYSGHVAWCLAQSECWINVCEVN